MGFNSLSSDRYIVWASFNSLSSDRYFVWASFNSLSSDRYFVGLPLIVYRLIGILYGL